MMYLWRYVYQTAFEVFPLENTSEIEMFCFDIWLSDKKH